MSAEINNIDEVVGDLSQTSNEFKSRQRGERASIAVAQRSGRVAVDLRLDREPAVQRGYAVPERSSSPDRVMPERAGLSRGFERRFEAQPTWPPAGQSGPGYSQPKPLPRRPKGRFIIGLTLLTVCAIIASAVWDAFLGVSAYGLVELDTLEVCAPWEGALSEYHVIEGQRVSKGQLLASVESFELKRQLQRLQDELNIANATLDATASRLEWESQSHAAEYFELWGSFLKSREELLRIDRDLVRARKVSDIIAEQELDHLELSASGQRSMLEKMAEALKQLKARSVGNENDEFQDRAELDQIRPAETRVEFLFGEIHRLEQQLQEGRLLSPVDGVVVRRKLAAGQRVNQSDSILEVVDSASARIVLYVQQGDGESLPRGTVVELKVDPSQQALQATVEATRQRFEPAPTQIQRFYMSGEPLLPVIVKPINLREIESLHDGAVVKLTLLSDLFSTQRPSDRSDRSYELTAWNVADCY